MFTISQLVASIRLLLESDDTLRGAWAEGEISNFVRASSGHCYFTLKDSAAAIPCVMWRSDARRLPRLPANGEQVAAHGSVSMYEAQGKVQFYVDHLEAAGLGQLYLALEALKARLNAEGLFGEERKRPLPAWPARIGVVTSPRAAALRDILRTIAARYPLAEVLLAPASVQGADAPPQIVAAIDLLNRWALEVERVDLIILARGGGSIEELWAFNDEHVVRAVASSRLPVVSGVGHETDFTLVDYAADVRAPTPTGAAALAVPDRADLAEQVADLRKRSALLMQRQLESERKQLDQLRRSLVRVSPRNQIASRRQQVDELNQSATRSMHYRLGVQRAQLEGLQARLQNLDPRAVLARGYAIVRRQDDQIVTTVAQVAGGDRVRVLVSDGEFETQVV